MAIGMFPAIYTAGRKFFSRASNDVNLGELVGSWFGNNLSPSDIQAANMNEEMAIRADERAFQNDIRAAREIPTAQVEGYQAAGLNPALMYQGAMSVPAQQGTAPQVENSSPQGLGSILAPLMQMAQIKSIIDERRSNVEVNKQRADLISKQSEGQGYQNEVTRESIDALIAMNNKQPELLDQKIKALSEQAESEDEKQKLMVLQQVRQQLDNDQFARMMDLVYQAQQYENNILSATSEYQAKIYDAQLREINKRIAKMTQDIEFSKEAQKYLGDKTWQQVLGGFLHELFPEVNPDETDDITWSDALGGPVARFFRRHRK